MGHPANGWNRIVLRCYILETAAATLPIYPRIIRDFLAIRKQPSSASGLVGYSLDPDLAHRTFWTFSISTDQASIDTFAASESHRHIINSLRPLVRPTRFSTTTHDRC